MKLALVLFSFVVFYAAESQAAAPVHADTRLENACPHAACAHAIHTAVTMTVLSVLSPPEFFVAFVEYKSPALPTNYFLIRSGLSPPRA